MNKLKLKKFLIELNPLKVHFYYTYNTQKITIVCEGRIELRNVLTKLKKKCKLHSIKTDKLTDSELSTLQSIFDIVQGVML